MSAGDRVIDHEGTEFESVSAMCSAWGVSRATYCARRKAGLSIEGALTKAKPKRGGRPLKPCRDHMGREFPSISAMCDAWSIKEETYRWRLRHKWSPQRALEAPILGHAPAEADRISGQWPETHQSPSEGR